MMYHPLLLATMLTAVLGSLGCKPKVPATTLQRVQRLYDEKLDGAASRAASVMVRDHSVNADAAAWIGGLAEYRQGHDEASRAFFKTATHSKDTAVAGGAQAMLGQLAARRADDTEALRRYDKAWTLLKGSDQRQVAVHALAVCSRDKQSPEASVWRSRLDGPSVAEAPTDRSFSLQAGAYRRRASADSHAATLSTQTNMAGLGPAIVRKRSDARGTWWLVQCGAFATRAEASAARRRMRSEDFVVARVGS
ncbi:MAG: SPOR domain-containing protein [Phycisphaerales bacterium]|nr:SPOR domain-containing protein [Phycisphaerales bacterium]